MEPTSRIPCPLVQAKWLPSLVSELAGAKRQAFPAGSPDVRHLLSPLLCTGGSQQHGGPFLKAAPFSTTHHPSTASSPSLTPTAPALRVPHLTLLLLQDPFPANRPPRRWVPTTAGPHGSSPTTSSCTPMSRQPTLGAPIFCLKGPKGVGEPELQVLRSAL